MNYERHLNKIRAKIFDYPSNKEEKAARVLRKLKARKIQTQPRSPMHDYHWMYAAEGYYS